MNFGINVDLSELILSFIQIITNGIIYRIIQILIDDT